MSIIDTTPSKRIQHNSTTVGDKLDSCVFPVGYIYISTSATNPGTLVGGTWESFGQGRMLISANSTYTAGSTGGSATHTLTIAEMPSHNHKSTAASVQGGGYNYAGVVVGVGDTGEQHNNITQSTGGGQAHNNMPPYISVYMWKRTA